MTDNFWYPFYVGDYDRKTAHLSLLEHGAYRRLMDHYYATKSPLPNDEKKLFRICGARGPSERKAVLLIVSEFFVRTEFLYVNKRCDSEIDKQLKYRERQSAAALKRHSHGRKQKIEENTQSVRHDFESESSLSKQSNQLELNDSHHATAMLHAPVPQPESKKTPLKVPLPDWVPADDWEAYLDMRKKIRKPVTPRAEQIAIAKLDALRTQGHTPAAVLQNSVLNAYTGLFPPAQDRNNATAKPQAQRSTQRDIRDDM